MSYREELDALWAEADQRRDAGEQPAQGECYERRDWLTEEEVQRAHLLGLQLELARRAV